MGGMAGDDALSEHRWRNWSKGGRSETWLSKGSTIICAANVFHVG
jgi:hypothetical protein